MFSEKAILASYFHVTKQCYFIGLGRGGASGGARPPNNLRRGANIPLGPPNNPPTFFFNFYVKQEKITNVPS